jgi:hypothetical protein
MQLCALIFILMTFGNAHAQDEATPKPPPPPKPVWTAHILREKDPKLRLQDLYIHEAKVPIMLVAREGGFRSLVEVRGRFSRSGWTLSAGTDPVRFTTPEGDFSIPAYVFGKVSEITLTAIGPNKEMMIERVFIYAPEAKEFKRVSPFDAVLIGIGGGFLHYSQTGSVYFKSFTGLVYGKVDWPNTEAKYSVYVSAEATGVTIDAAPLDVGPQLVRGKADFVYRRPKNSLSRWRMEYLVGVSYLTFISNGSPFGFSNLIAFEGGVRARYTAGPKTQITLEARYIPIKDPFGFENKGMDFEFTWSRILPNVHRFDLGFSYYNFNYHPDPGTRIDTGLLVYRVGYGI